MTGALCVYVQQERLWWEIRQVMFTWRKGCPPPPLTHPPAGSVYTWTHWSSCIFCKKPLLFDDSHIDKNQIINSCFRSASEITAFSASKASLQGECGQQGLIRGVQGEDARHTWAIPLPWPLNPRLARVASCHPVTVSRQSQLCPPCVTLSATSYIGSTANSSPHCHNFPSSQASSTQGIKILPVGVLRTQSWSC